MDIEKNQSYCLQEIINDPFNTKKIETQFYLHPIMLTEILLQFTSDEDTLIAALLHDIVEDTQISLLTIEAMFIQKSQN